MQKPSIGRIVIYVCEWIDSRTEKNAQRPAIITYADDSYLVSLTIFPDELNDAVYVDNRNYLRGRSLVNYDENNTVATWYWPPRV